MTATATPPTAAPSAPAVPAPAVASKIKIPREPREMPVTVAVNNSFGFGGHNASLLFRKA